MFDYYIDPETHKFEPWNKMVPKFELDPDMPLQVKSSRIKSKYLKMCKLCLINIRCKLSKNETSMCIQINFQYTDEKYTA